MGKKWKAVKEVAKEEWERFKGEPGLFTKARSTYKKSIKKQERSESRVAQRTGNKYMIGKKTTYTDTYKKSKAQAKGRPSGGWKPED